MSALTDDLLSAEARTRADVGMALAMLLMFLNLVPPLGIVTMMAIMAPLAFAGGVARLPALHEPGAMTKLRPFRARNVVVVRT